MAGLPVRSYLAIDKGDVHHYRGDKVAVEGKTKFASSFISPNKDFGRGETSVDVSPRKSRATREEENSGIPLHAAKMLGRSWQLSCLIMTSSLPMNSILVSVVSWFKKEFVVSKRDFVESAAFQRRIFSFRSSKKKTHCRA